jgi:hypothetical protein
MSSSEHLHPADREADLDSPIDAAIGPDSIEFGPWQTRLILFQRIAGGFMILKGLLHWSVLFSGAAFHALPIDGQAMTVFFAVIDLIAGVALWLGSAWGAAVWMIAVVSQIVAGFVFIDLSGRMTLLTIAELVLVAIFIGVRFKAYGEEQR